MEKTALAGPPQERRLAFFERYLSLWVGLCMVAGIASRQAAALGGPRSIRGLEFGQGSQINVPIAVLIWLMITPDDDEGGFRRHPQCGPEAGRPDGHAVRQLAGEAVLDGLAGLAFFPLPLSQLHLAPPRPISTLPAASSWRPRLAPRWSSCGATSRMAIPAYTLVQVSVNDLIMLVAFVPIVQFLVTGASSLIGAVSGASVLRDRLHRDPARGRHAPASVADPQRRARVVREFAAAPLRSGHHHGAAGNPGVHLRFPGRKHH